MQPHPLVRLKPAFRNMLFDSFLQLAQFVELQIFFLLRTDRSRRPFYHPSQRLFLISISCPNTCCTHNYKKSFEIQMLSSMIEKEDPIPPVNFSTARAMSQPRLSGYLQ